MEHASRSTLEDEDDEHASETLINMLVVGDTADGKSTLLQAPSSILLLDLI